MRLRPLVVLALVFLTVTPVSAADAVPGALGSPGVAASPSGEAPADIAAWVPVLRFWTPDREVTSEEIRAAVEGRSDRFRRVLVAGDGVDALWTKLGVTPAATTKSATTDEIVEAVGRAKRTLGLVPAAEVRPDLRALGVDGLRLFGAGRLDDLGTWPLAAPAGGAAADFDPADTWTLVAGGDVMLDREVYRKSVIEGKGPDYPWQGGYAQITSRTCCTVDGGPAITTKRMGRRGAVRELFSGADIAVVNHEGTAPDDHSYHPSGFTFTFDPAQLEGLVNAGIDVVSLANNHIRNAGSRGVRQTIRNLRRAGIRTMGAGKDEASARQPACLDADGRQVCFLGYNAINTSRHAVGEDRAGAALLRMPDVRADIRSLREAGADVIVVMPHWGPEYVTRVTPRQRAQGRAMVRAGADVVLGAHSHVAGPLEFHDGTPVLYSLGNLIFDLPRFEATEEGVIAELTFHGTGPAQVELHPTVIVARSQVNLLDRDGDGEVVVRRMRAASKELERPAASAE